MKFLFCVWVCAFAYLPWAFSWDEKYKNHGCTHTMEEPEFFTDTYCNKNAYCKDVNNGGAFYDETTKNCTMSLGGFCAYRVGDISCPPNAICNNECECAPRFIEVNGTCILGRSYQEDCSEDEVSVSPQSCDFRGGLQCRNGKCTCTEDGIVGAWNPHEFKCIPARCKDDKIYSNGSSTCTLLLSMDVSRIASYFAKCPTNSRFVESWNDYDEGRCTCESGFQESKNHFECVKGKNHGENCNSDQPCDLTLRLECDADSGTCTCKSGSIYNPSKDRCYSKQYCQEYDYYGTFFDDKLAACVARIDRECDPNSTDDKSCPANAKCEPNRWDKTTFRCNCPDGYDSTDDKTKCFLVKHYGEKCEKDGELDPCARSEKSSCLKDIFTCGCGENEEWNGKQCKFLVGHQCSAFNCAGSTCPGDNCANHQYCSNTNYLGNNGNCACRGGYSTDSKENVGHCLGEYLSGCDVKEECHKGMKCLDGKCKCTDPLISKYDQKRKFCIISVGGKCTGNGTTHGCTQNANCVNGHCQCSDGYSKSDFGECVTTPLGYGEKCEAGKCGLKQGLACESGTCSCIWDTMTFTSGRGCLAPLGERCGFIGVDPNCLENSNKCKFYTVGCQDSAICKEVNSGLSQCIKIKIESKLDQPSAPPASP